MSEPRHTRWGDDDWPEDGLCMDCASDIPSGLLQCDACERASLEYFSTCARIDARTARFQDRRARWGWVAYIVNPLDALWWHIDKAPQS